MVALLPKILDLCVLLLEYACKVDKTLKEAGQSFLPVFFPRLLAAFCVLLLIGGLSLTCVVGIAIVGPTLRHGMNVSHASGKITSIGPGKNFVLVTATGRQLFFHCDGAECHASLGHMQRHLRERANTDV